jgi:UDPglucose 6-dehydrogenase
MGERMKITVIGAGYVGLVTAACLAELGNDVMVLDTDEVKIQKLSYKVMPIYEPGLEAIIARNMGSLRLSFTTDVARSVDHGVIQIIAVQTPQRQDGAADINAVLTASRAIAEYMTEYKVVVLKSTVPVGTCDAVHEQISACMQYRSDGVSHPYAVLMNPEFLKEGSGVADFMHPDRIILGCGCESLEDLYAKEMMTALYAPFNRLVERTQWMTVRDAEFTKYAANAMLATRISFMNEMANLSEKLGVDIDAVRRGIGADPRIGPSFLYPGMGYGGTCLPKDVSSLLHQGSFHEVEMKLMRAVHEVNQDQKRIITDKIECEYDNSLSGMHFAIWGLAFKANTDDVRNSPALLLIQDLVSQGATVSVYDPQATSNARVVLRDRMPATLMNQIEFVDTAMATLPNADALVIMTEWLEFRSPDLQEVKALLKTPTIFDGRNLFDPREMKELGFKYQSIGR